MFGLVQPIWRPAVVNIESVFMLPSKRPGQQVLRAALHRILGKTCVDSRFGPAHTFDPRGRNQYLFARQPIPGCYLNVADSPGFIIDHEAVHMADFTISRFHVIAGDGFGAAEVRIRGLQVDRIRHRFPWKQLLES
jgi:hypothetical protein